MQSADAGHDHHPARLRLALACALVALAGAASAHAARYAALPSPLASLSATPPLTGGAAEPAENVRHTVRASTIVRVSVDADGAPFAITADQTLHVGIQGDYFFLIGAPVLDVEALPGSASTPGLRQSSIVWQGFNPLNRTLGAHAVLDAAAAASTLPLRIERHGDVTTFVNATGVDAAGYRADAEVAPLHAYLAQVAAALRRGDVPPAGGAQLTSLPRPARFRVAVPLRLTGSVGGQLVSALVLDRLAVHASGPVRIRVTPVNPTIPPTAGRNGRSLLAVAQRVLLTYARARQYGTFLANPDPTGASMTVYRYRTASRPAPPVAAATPRSGSGHTLLVLAGIVVVAGAGLIAWARA